LKSSFKILSSTTEVEVGSNSYPENRIALIQRDKIDFNAWETPTCKIQTNIAISEKQTISTDDS